MPIKPIFINESSQGLRLLVVICIAIILMFAERSMQHFQDLRMKLSIVVYPIQKIVDLPLSGYAVLQDHLLSHRALALENQELHIKQLFLNAKLQKLAALEVENTRLKELLGSSAATPEHLIVASILRIDPDPFLQQILLDKGKRHGVYLGQPIVDAHGVMGSVIEVNALTSRVMLLTDPSHAVPVENRRNGVRAIASGISDQTQLVLKHVTNPSDIMAGDVFVTSGLDGRYPAGYPVGIVKDIQHDTSKPFASIYISPVAELDKGRQVLLVKTVAANQVELLQSAVDPNQALPNQAEPNNE